jgi:hypothetical protein
VRRLAAVPGQTLEERCGIDPFGNVSYETIMPPHSTWRPWNPSPWSSTSGSSFIGCRISSSHLEPAHHRSSDYHEARAREAPTSRHEAAATDYGWQTIPSQAHLVTAIAARVRPDTGKSAIDSAT